MDIITIQSVWTVVAFILFVGILIWAFLPGRRKDFDEAAQLPLDDEIIVNNESKTENQHG